ncbi:hypothetical protein [Rhodobacter capsulatus]|uniref:hypothetical protein n=1 Tax=Rhodobacter capsulatus TaxID=1061 RepID=UPI004026A16F
MRKTNISVYQSLYDKRGRIGDPCVYCGSPSSTLDHVPPISHIETMSISDALCDFDPALYPACSECNSAFLGAKWFHNMNDRKSFVADCIKKKYKRILNFPKWTDDDLKEMSPEMVDEIRATERLSDDTKKRLEFALIGFVSIK